MAAPRPRKQFALDTNILYDLAEGLDAAHTLREVLQERGAILQVPPTVIQELTHAMLTLKPTEAAVPLRALQNLQAWGLNAFDLKLVGHGISQAFCTRLIRKGHLPEGEENDGFIVAESALAEIPVLISRDAHLLDIDAQSLLVELHAADLSSVQVVHPKVLLASLRR